MREESVPQEDDLLYRDYLISVMHKWTTESTTLPNPSTSSGQETFSLTKPPLTPTGQLAPAVKELIQYQSKLMDLQKRFKQDFSTKDETLIGADQVAIEVVRAILTEDLKVAAATIPAQGTETDQSYLQTLISLTHEESDTLQSLSSLARKRPLSTSSPSTPRTGLRRSRG